MRILNIPDMAPSPPAAAPSLVPLPTPLPAPIGLDMERVETLENVAKSILEKIQTIEERMKVLESRPKSDVRRRGSAETSDFGCRV